METLPGDSGAAIADSLDQAAVVPLGDDEDRPAGFVEHSTETLPSSAPEIAPCPPRADDDEVGAESA